MLLLRTRTVFDSTEFQQRQRGDRPGGLLSLAISMVKQTKRSTWNRRVTITHASDQRVLLAVHMQYHQPYQGVTVTCIYTNKKTFVPARQPSVRARGTHGCCKAATFPVPPLYVYSREPRCVLPRRVVSPLRSSCGWLAPCAGPGHRM